MDIKDLEQIINILKQNDVTEFELEQEGTSIKLSRQGKQMIAVQQSAPVEVAPQAVALSNGSAEVAVPGAAEGSSANQIPSSWNKVESPIVGTFYRKPNPDADPFVKVGDSVTKGQTLCIVEAMKLMNEIEAPMGGKVEKICLDDGAVVEFGEVLFYINPSA